MLILSRREEEDIVFTIGGETVIVRILNIERRRIRVGIIADEKVKVLRGELLEREREETT